MYRSHSVFSQLVAAYVFLAVILQVARVQFGDALFLSVLNQLALVAVLIATVGFISKKNPPSVILQLSACHLALVFPVLFHIFAGKNALVLILGHLDNLKFILPLSLFLLVKREMWAVRGVGLSILNALWWLIIIGVAFGIAQQLIPQLATFFLNEDELRMQYRYGILRVPSFFAEINAFARISFLLIPLATILNKRVSIALAFSIIGIVLAFSRQFILGALIATMLAFAVVATRRLSVSVRAIVFLFIITAGSLVYSVFSITVFATGEDGKLLSVSESYIRTGVAMTSFEAIKDRPLTGVGPGYFGGNIGKKFGITEDLYGYGLLRWVPYFDLEGVHYTDTLWPQLLAEYGIPGAAAIIILLSLWFKRINSTQNLEYKAIGLICYFQFVLSGIASPVFNFLYFSMAMLILTLMLASYPEKGR